MIYFFINFLIALFFIILGIIGIILPWSAGARTQAIEFILTNSISLSLFGFTFLVAGLASLFQIVQGSKKQYFTLTREGLKADVSENVIKFYLVNYFQEIFPYTEVPCQIDLKKSRLDIMADLPYVHKQEQKELLKKIEADLSELFREVIGYQKDLRINISFQPEKLK
jgi:hypothetical protein